MMNDTLRAELAKLSHEDRFKLAVAILDAGKADPFPALPEPVEDMLYFANEAIGNAYNDVLNFFDDPREYYARMRDADAQDRGFAAAKYGA